MKNTKVQLNVDVSAEVSAAIRKDAAEFGVSLSTLVEFILRSWGESFSVKERAALLEAGGVPHRKGGRKINLVRKLMKRGLAA